MKTIRLEIVLTNGQLGAKAATPPQIESFGNESTQFLGPFHFTSLPSISKTSFKDHFNTIPPFGKIKRSQREG